MIISIYLHSSKDPYGLGGVMNVFLFPDLSPAVGSELALLTRRWDAVFGRGTLASFNNTILLLGRQKFSPVDSWDEAASQLEAWAVFGTVFPSTADMRPASANIMALVE